MNLREGVQVVNLIHASRLTADAKDKSTQEIWQMQATNELAHLLQDVLRAEARMRLTRLQLLLFVERKPEEVIGYLNKLPPQFEQHCPLLKELRAAAAAKCCGEYLKAMFPMGEGREQS